MLKLYYAKGTIASASAVALFETGLEFDAINVDFAQNEQRGDAFLALNPKGRVPVLVTDHGLLTETGAILDYIADIAPAANLRPTDQFAAAQLRAAMYYFASTAHVNHAHKVRGTRWVTEEASIKDMQAKVPQTMTESAAYIEQNILTGPFILGDQISMADPYLYTVTTWMPGDGVDMSAFPKIQAFIAAMESRPSVQTAMTQGFFR